MLKFIRSHFAHPEKGGGNEIYDYANFEKTTQHGFPNKTTAFAYDPILGLLAIGTDNGEISMFGADNYLWHNTFESHSRIAHMFFAEGTGNLVALSHDLAFHKATISERSLNIQSIPADDRLKKITSCAMYPGGSREKFALLIGTPNGDIFALDVEEMKISEFLPFNDELDSRVNLVNESLKSLNKIDISRGDPNRLLLLYDQSVVIYDVSVREVISNWNLETSPTDTRWSQDGKSIIISFSDGSFTIYDQKGEILEEPGIVFGPFPCMPVGKALMANTEHGPIQVFSGGMPRASYGDRYTVTTIRSGKTVCWDFPSPVLDFSFASTSKDLNDNANWRATVLLILTEEELVVISIGGKEWKPIPLRCLHPLHSSPITNMIHVSNVDQDLWTRLLKHSCEKPHSNWPLFYAPTLESTKRIGNERQLLLTGHANGNIWIWSAGEASMQLLYKIETSREVAGCSEESPSCVKESTESDSEESDCQVSDEWPPFRKAGDYDPCSDDLRLAVQRLAFDPKTGSIAVGCRGGHAIVYQLHDSPQTCDPPSVLDCSLVKDQSTLSPAIKALKGVEPRTKSLNYPAGYQPRSNNSSFSLLVQLSPCVPITAIAINGTRSVMAIGTEFGFVLVDYAKTKIEFHQSLLEQHDLADAGALDESLSRFKSMKKSIRQSFRRKKKTNHAESVNEHTDDEICRPVERRIESRGTPQQGLILEPSKGLVRFLKFLPNPLSTSSNPGDSLWVGTNGGRLYAFNVQQTGEVCKLEREIRLQHGAPIINIEVINETIKSIPISRLLLITEEQIRGYTLPLLRPTKYKLKLTANEGFRIRKANLVNLHHIKGENSTETFLSLLTNMGDEMIYSTHNHRKRLRFQVMRSIDIAGISSCVISNDGEMFWLRPGASQLQRGSLCAPQAPPPIPPNSPVKPSNGTS